LNSLKGEKDFLLPELAQGEKDFIWCLNLPRVYISSPLDALRTFSLSRLHSLNGEEDFILPALAQSRGGLYLFSPQDARER